MPDVNLLGGAGASPDGGTPPPQAGSGFVGNNENPLTDRMGRISSQPQGNPQSGAPQQQQVNPAALADVAHHSMLGKAFRSLMGNEVNYSVDPQTGKLVTTESEQKPGAIWRGILAGALLGGQTAARSKAVGFTQGLAEGGGAEVEEKQKQDLLKRSQAQQDFENQLKAQKGQREAKGFDSEEKLRQAQIAFHNAQTIRENQLTHNENFKFHEEVSKNGNVQLQPFIDAGLPYAYKDTGESEMNEIIKNNPNAAHLLWEPTGTRVVAKPDGTFDHELTYSAVDPKGNVKITDDWIKRAKEVGLDQIYGTATWDILKKDKQLSASEYMAANQKLQELDNKKTADKKKKFDENKEQASLDLMKAQTSHFKAEAAKLYADERDRKILEEAWSIYSSGGDVTKLSAKAKTALSKTLTDIIKTQVDELKALPKDPATGQISDQDKAKELYQNAENYQKIIDRIYGVKPEEKPTAAAQTGKESEAVQNVSELMDQDKIDKGGRDAYDYISSKTGISREDKAAAIKKYATIPWDAVTSRASQEGISNKKMYDRLVSQGFKVQSDPDEDMSTMPIQQ